MAHLKSIRQSNGGENCQGEEKTSQCNYTDDDGTVTFKKKKKKSSQARKGGKHTEERSAKGGEEKKGVCEKEDRRGESELKKRKRTHECDLEGPQKKQKKDTIDYSSHVKQGSIGQRGKGPMSDKGIDTNINSGLVMNKGTGGENSEINGDQTSAISRLCQMEHRVKFTSVRQTNPSPRSSHKKIMSVTVNGKTFEGTGPNRKLAKKAAAEKALREILEERIREEKKMSKKETVPVPMEKGSEKQQMDVRWTKKPVKILCRLIPGIQFMVDSISTQGDSTEYVILVQVNDKTFSGTGSTKKLAKQAAARKALKEISAGTLAPHPGRGQNAPASLSNGNTSKLRHIVIDGNNVAMNHGGKKSFSVMGIKICIDYFLARGHKVTAFISGSWRYKDMFNGLPVIDKPLLDVLESDGVLKVTPCRRLSTGQYISSYDDRYVLNLADAQGGIVVSNDQYRDLLDIKPSYKLIIETRLLPFMFVDDIFMPPDDPLGREGPSLDVFLRVGGDDTVEEEAIHSNQSQFPSLIDSRTNFPSSTTPTNQSMCQAPHTISGTDQSKPQSLLGTPPKFVFNQYSQSQFPSLIDSRTNFPNSTTSTNQSICQVSHTIPGTDQSKPQPLLGTPPKFVFNQYRSLKQLGLSQNFDKDVVDKALQQCDLTSTIQPDDFLDFVKFMKSQK